MKIKQLLFLTLTLGFGVAKSQCNISLSNVNQAPIICNGGSANLSFNVIGGAPTYTYSFGTFGTDTIAGDTMVWAQSVLGFSSEYGGGWSASEILHAPDIYPNYGDLSGSWTTTSNSQREYIVMSYPTTLAAKVNVYETNEPGSCDTVYVRSASTGIWHTIYTGTATTDPPVATIKSYTIPSFIGAINAVRLAVDGSIATYYEIDAVGLVSTSISYALNFTNLTADTYTLSITDAAACTFTTSFVFTDPAPITYTQNLTICSNQFVDVGGSYYNTTGNYIDILTSAQGCDSTVYTNLTVNSGNATYSYIDTILCAGQTLTVGSIIHSLSGHYADTLVNAEGCDSIVDVMVKIYTTNNPMVTVKEIPNKNIATGGTANAPDYYGTNYPGDAFDGDYDLTGWGNDGTGLPSWLEYDYGAGNSKVVKAYSFYCSSNMDGGWSYNGYDPGEWNFQGYNGSSWVNLDTVVDNNPVQDAWNTYLINNNTAYQKYRMYVTNTMDGSYVMITELKLLTTDSCSNKLFAANANDIAKDSLISYQWQVNGTNVGTNLDSLNVPSFHYGDVVTCNVTLNHACATATTATGGYTITTGQAVASASVTGLVLTAYPAGRSYQWYDCTTMTNIGGATGQSYTVTANGSYAAIVLSGTCLSDTSNCIVISNVGLKENIANAAMRLYPNPNNGIFNLDVNMETVDVQILDMLGNVVYTATHNKGTETLNLSHVAKGVYLVKVTANNIQTTNRLIIN